MAKKEQINIVTAIHRLDWTTWASYDQAMKYAAKLPNFQANESVYQEAARRLTKK